MLEDWEGFIRQLRASNVRLNNREDKLIWDYHPSGCYTPKHGYIQLNVLDHNREMVWWWKQLWKLKCLGKEKLLFWAILENKAPTWDILKKRFIKGPGFCVLCRKDEETIQHLFVQCSYSQTIWNEVGKQLGYIGGWQGDSALIAFQNWWAGKKYLRAVPCIFAWGIWITRNKIIFQDCRTPMESVVAQIVVIIQHFREPEKIHKHRPVREELIDKTLPWGFFDGTSQIGN